jgi:hypothetical protein
MILTDGIIEIESPRVIITPKTTREDFLASPLFSISEPRNQNTPWSRYAFKSITVGSEQFAADICFCWGHIYSQVFAPCVQNSVPGISILVFKRRKDTVSIKNSCKRFLIGPQMKQFALELTSAMRARFIISLGDWFVRNRILSVGRVSFSLSMKIYNQF